MVFDDSSLANQQKVLSVARADPHAQQGVRTDSSLTFFQQNLGRIVDDVISVIKGSIELWPTLVEISYFQKDRRGLPQWRVNNRKAGAR